MKNENTRRNIIVSITTILLAVSIGATSLSHGSYILGSYNIPHRESHKGAMSIESVVVD